MKIQDQVCTIEQAKRFKELGIAQESLFYFNWLITGHEHGIPIQFGKIMESEYLSNWQQISAFTVAELGIMLPENVSCFRSDGKFEINVHKGLYPMPQIQDGFNYFVVKGDTEAEARAAMLIFLMKERLVSASQINEALLTPKQ